MQRLNDRKVGYNIRFMSDRTVQQLGSVWPLIDFNKGLTDLTAAFDGRPDDQFGTFDDPFEDDGAVVIYCNDTNRYFKYK